MTESNKVARRKPARKPHKAKLSNKARLASWGAWLLSAGRANAAILIICLFITTISTQAWWRERQRANVAEFGFKTQAPATKNTDAVITKKDWATRGDLKEIMKAVRVLDGKLVAGLKLHVPEKKQEVQHDSLETKTSDDSTRTATFKDSTFAGTLEGKVVAPPTGPLGLSYILTRPAFDPEIGFMEKNGQTYALVSWRGEKFQIKSAYAPKVNHPRKIVPFTTLAVDVEKSWIGQVGVETRSQLFGVGGWVAVQFEGGENPRSFVGGKKEW